LSAADMVLISFEAFFKCSRYCFFLSAHDRDLSSDNSLTRDMISSEYHFALSLFSHSSISSMTSWRSHTIIFFSEELYFAKIAATPIE
jgi:hypothetical protein